MAEKKHDKTSAAVAYAFMNGKTIRRDNTEVYLKREGNDTHRQTIMTVNEMPVAIYYVKEGCLTLTSGGSTPTLQDKWDKSIPISGAVMRRLNAIDGVTVEIQERPNYELSVDGLPPVMTKQLCLNGQPWDGTRITYSIFFEPAKDEEAVIEEFINEE